SLNTSGAGSLQWTDKGTSTSAVSGAAVTWGDGNALNGNSFFERPADFSNYNRLTFRMSATDALNGGGNLGVQAFFQTGNYEAYRTTSGGAVGTNGEINLPIDGQFHDLVFPLDNTPNRELVMAFGVNLFSHTNDLIINVDSVIFDTVAGVPGDYNGNGVVDGGDYVRWRNGGPLQNEVATPNSVTAEDYTEWRARFGNTSGSGSLNGGAVPEPSGIFMLLALASGSLISTRRKK
ncbi:MAG: PEP-CTERM sorting domain-containing protein, partial [Pirellulales bacterium]